MTKRNQKEAPKENPGDLVVTEDQAERMLSAYDDLGDLLEELGLLEEEDE